MSTTPPLSDTTDEEAMAAALPYLRRLSHCEALHPMSRFAADGLARTVERLASRRALRSVPEPTGERSR